VVNERVVTSPRLNASYDVDVLPLQFASSIADVRTISPKKVLRILTTGAQLAKRLAFARPDFAYFTFTPNGAAFYRDCLYVALMKLFRVPRAYHLHSRAVVSNARPMTRRLATWAFRDAWVIHLSPLLRGDTEDLVDDEHSWCIPNATEDPGEIQRTRTGKPRILYLSNMIEEKGALVLVEALALLKRRGLSIEATFAGARFNDGCVEKVEAAIAEHGLSDVTYVGPVYGGDKDRLFREYDILAYPTLRDAFPLVVLEAMAYGLPVVASQEGAIPHMVEPGKTGLLVPPGDAGALATQLERLVSDSSLAATMGKAARARFDAEFTLERFDEALAAAIDHFVTSDSVR
jgi:glycosyltransferase involved in cell wall biosynthesis